MDGGWGWMIVLASFTANMLIDGVNHSFGIFLPHLAEYFQANQGTTALVGSTFSAMGLLAAPVASVMVNAVGSRATMIVGGMITGISIACAPLCSNITSMMLVYGVFAGFGHALCYVPSIVHVALYFEKRRALATGIATAGSGLGLFLFAPLFQWTIEKYSWKGALLFASGAFLNCCVCGALLRPVNETAQEKEADRPKPDADVILTQMNQAKPHYQGPYS